MKKPELTVAQLVGLLTAGIPILANLAVAFGVYTVSPAEQHALSESVQWGGTAASALFFGDGIIRHGRSRALAPAPQNITVLDPGASQRALSGTGTAPPPGAVAHAGDSDVDAPEPGGAPPAGE